jgi:RimJ/RimL family protein N-acetyltransferase
MALIHRKTGELVGQCGLLKQTLDGRTELEIGYHIIPRFRGRGFATEAARAFKQYAFDNNLSDSIVSIIHVDNVRSQRVAEKNGMQRESKTEEFGVMPGVPHYVYRAKACDVGTERVESTETQEE